MLKTTLIHSGKPRSLLARFLITVDQMPQWSQVIALLFLLGLLLNGCTNIERPAAVELSDGVAVAAPMCGPVHDRGIECVFDLMAGPCTHWALLNYQELQREGYAPRYVTLLIHGDGHMAVVYRRGGEWLMRDGGVPGYDEPVSYVATHGYELISWENPDNHQWTTIKITETL